jgi:exodeoxyribonuclease VII large subunit
MKENAYTVSQVSNYIKKMFSQDFMLRRICIKGEVSNLKYHSSGHIYFTLKDQSATMAAVMWKSARKGLQFPMKDGDTVICTGSVEVYEAQGRYQFYAKEIRSEGEGYFAREFERLKKELGEMGMFSPEYKKELPFYAARVGIVTAPTGAAIQDIRNISTRRNPGVELILYPAQVQGEGAVESIVRGLRRLDRYGVDVIICGRGGGSIEDLWAFNTEEVARAIFECQTPVISAVGHETDTTIADFVADLRAPTPSAAAEIAVCEVSELLDRIQEEGRKLFRLMQNQIQGERSRIKQAELRLKMYSPEQLLNLRRSRLVELEMRFYDRMEHKLEREKNRLAVLSEKLDGLSPLKQMARGYTFVTNEEHKAVTSVKMLAAGEKLTLYLSDGRAKVQVEEREEGYE